MGGAVALETRSPGRAPHGALDGGFLSPLLPQLLNSLSVDPDAECKHGLYFRDGRRKVDYILVYHHKRASGSRTPARRAQHGDAGPAVGSSRQDQPLPGKAGPVGAGEPEPPLDYHEDDKRFRREEYEGNLVEAGLELERDEDVTMRARGREAGAGEVLLRHLFFGRGPCRCLLVKCGDSKPAPPPPPRPTSAPGRGWPSQQ